MVAVALACGGLPAGCSGGSVSSGAGRTPSCVPNAVYGPPTCASDEDCLRQGPGWVCDPTAATFDDGCGGTTTWGRICRPGASVSAAPGDAIAGPSASVEEESDGGLDAELQVQDVSSASSRRDAVSAARVADAPCSPDAVYGPRQCTDDAMCVRLNGAGWVCDTNHTFDDGCREFRWPLCRRSDAP